ncbi:hypothetical protein GXW78_12340 [Roseomonas terrae]|uniref:Uncharacterized protein n=1 Tax=Neoroseomonas terrae TaxID=424799 RepID=A0ABS5EHE6_9PROT|nr:hypothetical protein [Neoroseomonas terrae]MBR0650456.1 hypothetical protein [Neoroseomonas terrae]
MSDSDRIDPATVPLELLQRYVRAQGWRNATRAEVASPEVSRDGEEAFRSFLEARSAAHVDYRLMVNPADGLAGVKLVVPVDTKGPDFLSRIDRAVRLLAAIEGRAAGVVARAIRSVGFDAMFSRLPDIMVQSDTVSLKTATDHIAAFKSALVSTAMTEHRPVSHYDQPSKAATDYAEACRFGHTFRGSFGFSIESPLERRDGDPLLADVEPTPPFERRVVARFVRGLRAVAAAGSTRDLEPLMDGPEHGFGANAYEAVASLIETSGVGFAIDVSLSPEWLAPPDIGKQASVSLAPIHAEVAREAGRALRRRLTPEFVEIVGMVVTLRSEQNPQLLDPRGSQVLTVKWTSPKHGEIRTQVRVSAEDYLAAIRAHQEGQAIRVKGTLEHRHGWVLVDPSPLH